MTKTFALCSMLLIFAGSMFSGESAQLRMESEATAFDIADDNTSIEIESLMAQISAAEESGIEPDQVLLQRLDELLSLSRGDNSLDQGGENCAGAMIIPSVPFIDTGTTGTTNNCTGAPYRDVFYKYTAQSSGAHTFDMCGSPGNLSMKLSPDGGCCPSVLSLTGDNECTTQAPQVTVALDINQVVYIECGTASMTAPAQSYVFHAYGPNPSIAGDHCSNAIPYPGISSTVTGNTCIFLDDYNAACEWIRYGAKDVVYSYSPLSSQQVTFSLCQSGYNTRMYIFDGQCTGTPYACNDETPGCGDGHQSRIECVQLLAGHTYYIVVDGWDIATCGNYVLASESCQPCTIVCPPNSQDEGEPPCHDGYSDSYNGGCWGNPQVFTSIACGDVFCGTFGTFTGNLDHDWYRLILDEQTTIDWCVYAEYAPETFIFTTPCNGSVLSTGVGGACDTFCLTATLLPGTYDLMVEPWHFGSTPCGTRYAAWLTCESSEPNSNCECQDLPNTHCNLLGGSIPDFDSIEVTVEVPVQYHITDLNVCLDAVHPRDGQLSMTLISPAGTSISLCSNRGGLGQNFSCTTFDDEATTPISSGSAPFSGAYRPEQSLSVVDGQIAAGNWRLRIADLTSGDVGTLESGCLTFEYDLILPVNLVSFSATPGDGSAALSWTTASESGNDHFELLRDGLLIADIQGAGTSPTTHNYHYSDTELTNDETYAYTLITVGLSGNREQIAQISATPRRNGVSVTEYALYQNYPNPFNSITTVSFDLKDAGFVSLKVYNLNGREVHDVLHEYRNAGRYQVTFDASNLSSGMYLYTIKAGEFTDMKKMLLLK